MDLYIRGASPEPVFWFWRKSLANLILKDPRDHKHWPSSRSERRQDRRIATRDLRSLGVSDVFRLWTDKENLGIDTIVNRREWKKNGLWPFKQKHAFRGQKRETKNS